MTEVILVVDDDQSMCELVQVGLKKYGFAVEWRTKGADALALVAEREFSALIVDLNLGSMSGLDICKQVRANRPTLPVIVVTAFGDMKSAIAAVRAGAHDFINKPLEIATLAHTVEKAVKHRNLENEVKRLRIETRRNANVGGLLGKSASMKKVYDLIQRVAETDVSVLITGESGTGKELVARALHTEGGREENPFVPLNCAAVPANLLESELFGHVAGAFTDAKKARQGIFEQAQGGTVLLDEIGEMPLEMQPKLLRVLQEKTVRPVGGNKDVTFDTRIVAATNRDLETEVEEGRFREDLYYRLNVVQVHVPPLRARGGDILLLAQHFVDSCAKRSKKKVVGIASEAASKLLDFDWPGNVRQLENCMERAVTLTRFDQITVEDLPDRVCSFQSKRMDAPDVDMENVLTLEELERRYIERVLSASDGNKTQAAKALGVDRRTLYRKLERYEKQSL